MNDLEREFVGLFLGEGSIVFIARKSSPKNTQRGWKPSFQIHMRADDYPMLKFLQKELGGKIYHKKARLRYMSKGTPLTNPLIENPSCYWMIFRREECIRIISLLEQSVLPSVKIKQVKIIKELVDMKPDKQGKSKFGQRYSDKQIDQQNKLYQQIISSRIFRSS